MGPVGCEYCEPLIHAYARNELSIEIVLPIHRHLVHCLACGAKLIQFVMVDKYLREEMEGVQPTDLDFWMLVSRVQKRTFESLWDQTGKGGINNGLAK